MEAFEILTGGLGRVKDEFGAIRQDVERRREFEGKKESPDYKACTIRLPAHTVYLIDAFAAECEMSRNDVVAILVNDSLGDALYGFWGDHNTAASFAMEVDQAFASGLSWSEWKETEQGGRK